MKRNDRGAGEGETGGGRAEEKAQEAGGARVSAGPPGCQVQPPTQAWERGGEARVGPAGWPCQLPNNPLPPPAAPVGSSQPPLVSAGNNGELCHQLPPPKEVTAMSPGQGQQLGLPLSQVLPGGAPHPTAVSSRLLSLGVPYICWQFAHDRGGGGQEWGSTESTRGSGCVGFSLSIVTVAETASCPSLSVPPFFLMNCHP